MTAQAEDRRQQAASVGLMVVGWRERPWMVAPPAADGRVAGYFATRMWSGRIAVALIEPDFATRTVGVEAFEFSAEELEARRDLRNYGHLTSLDVLLRMQGVAMGREDYLAEEPAPVDDEAHEEGDAR